MGLSASQARILLLTSKNNALELQAQSIENERLILAQRQEDISNEYSDSTANQVYKIFKTDGNGNKEEFALTGQTLAECSPNKTYVICDSQGKALFKISSGDPDTTGKATNVTYQKNGGSESKNATTISPYHLNAGPNSPFQQALRTGALQIWEADGDTNDAGSTSSNKMGIMCKRVSPEAISNVSSKYYTEDDSAAQAEYQTAMSRINTLDTKLENKLNQVETQKKAVEQEIESAESLVKSNEERTFKYFS